MDKVYKEVAPVSEEARAAITRKTAYSLPDEPSARGMPPDQIRKRFWEAVVGDRHSLLAEIDRVAKETNEALEGIAGSTGGMSGVIVTPQMYGAMGDGVTDDTAAIQAALDASSYVYIPDGVYLVNGTHDGWGHSDEGGIKPKSNQVIELSNNAVLKAKENKNGFYNIVNIVGVENVHIKGGKVQGIKTTPTSSDYGSEFGCGVNVQGSKNITVEQMEIFDCWGDSVTVGYTNGVDSYNVKVLNCVLHDSRRQGISIIGVNYCEVVGCEIYNIAGTMPQSGIDIEPDGTGDATNINIDSCYIHDTERYSIITARGDGDENEKGRVNIIGRVKITNCRLDNGLAFCNGENLFVSGSTLETIEISCESVVGVTGCHIDHVLIAGGDASFNNCEFFGGSSGNSIITSDMSFYPNSVTKLLEFNHCRFKTMDSSGMFMLLGQPSVASDEPPERVMIFNSCQIEITGAGVFSNRLPGELVMDGCDVTFATPPYSLFDIYSKAFSKKIVLRDSNFTWQNQQGKEYGVTDLVSFGSYEGYAVDIYNCKFSNAMRCFNFGSDGEAGGKIRMFNNIVSSEATYGSHKFDIVFANDLSKVAKTSDIPTKVSQLDNDAKYLTGDAASSAVSGHNTSTEAHNDIRLLIGELTTRLNALANSTDEDLDQMAEIVAYIKANKSLIESITTSKVSVSDIINNLTTNVSNKPLSAAQGVELKKLVEQTKEDVKEYVDDTILGGAW